MATKNDSANATLERRRNFRSKARPGRRVELFYSRSDAEDTAIGEKQALAVTGNIGAGGAFVLTGQPEPIGTELNLSVQMPDREESLELQGEVRWTTPGDPDGGGGMGIKFKPLEVSDLMAFSDYLATLSERSQ